jgi:phosphohistidine phosphatase
MTHELMLLRHGKSDWSVLAGDFDRPLTKRGKRGSKSVGCWLKECDGVPDHIVTSPAKRALATAHRAAKYMDIDVDSIVKDQRMYGAGVSDMLAVLRDCPEDAGRVMLVGHNPGLEDMVLYLADEKVVIPADGKLMPTATLAWFTFSCGWEELKDGCATLKSIIRPADMLSNS